MKTQQLGQYFSVVNVQFCLFAIYKQRENNKTDKHKKDIYIIQPFLTDVSLFQSFPPQSDILT